MTYRTFHVGRLIVRRVCLGRELLEVHVAVGSLGLHLPHESNCVEGESK